MSALGKFLVTVFFVAIILWIAIFNREPISISLPPFWEGMMVPSAVVILCAALLGFIWGAAIVWLNGGSVRSEARRLRREVKQLENETVKKESA